MTELPLQTERLSIRDFNENDSESLFQLYRIPETSQFESWSIVDDETEATEILQFWTKNRAPILGKATHLQSSSRSPLHSSG